MEEMMFVECRPGQKIGCVYSNFDHEFDEAVKIKLMAGGCYAQHAAMDFCAYVWFDNGIWKEQVCRFNSPVETRSNEDLTELIAETNDKYGNN